MNTKIIITLGSEIVFCGIRELTIQDNILSFNDNRYFYLMHEGSLLKIRIGEGSEESIEHGYYIDKRTEGEIVNFKLIS